MGTLAIVAVVILGAVTGAFRVRRYVSDREDRAYITELALYLDCQRLLSAAREADQTRPYPLVARVVLGHDTEPTPAITEPSPVLPPPEDAPEASFAEVLDEEVEGALSLLDNEGVVEVESDPWAPEITREVDLSTVARVVEDFERASRRGKVSA